ncbi:MAG: MFS transporter [Actinomycetota bacterium]|nr:MFS transporter [Actinomycetota bacterium]
MTFAGDLSAVLRERGFRRLFAVRLVSQLSDGVFQVALASNLLFSPERAPDARSIAVALTVVLLPFTALGPFVGVLLDRWHRRLVIVGANAVRVVLLLLLAVDVARGDQGPLFYALVLVTFSVNRFLLAGLSAGQPRVVPSELLVTANSIGPTCGSLTYLVGLAAGGAVRGLGGSDALILVTGAACYGLSALTGLRLPELGPSLDEVPPDVRRAARDVLHGMVAAMQHLPPLARLALGVASAIRLPYAVVLVATVLLYRRHFPGVGTGFEGVGIAAAAAGLGFGVAAVATPVLTVRIGTGRYVALLSAVAGVVVVVPGAFFTPWAVTVTSFGLGVTTQGVKICVDTTVQLVVADVYRGRLFALYDVLFNAVLILGAILAAVVLPPDGASYAVVVGAGLWYLAVALLVTRHWRADADLSPVVPAS